MGMTAARNLKGFASKVSTKVSCFKCLQNILQSFHAESSLLNKFSICTFFVVVVVVVA